MRVIGYQSPTSMLLRFGTACVAAATLAGCSAAVVPSGSPELPGAVHMSSAHPVANTTLLYVSNPGSNKVEFYVYEKGVVGKKLGAIAIPDPTGLCTDRAGDVYVVSYSGHRVAKFLHGETSPSSSIRFTAYPYACAVDQSNNDLAISVQQPHGKYYKGGYVDVYPGGQSRTRRYGTEIGFAKIYFLAYDDKHDLFATADQCTESYCNYGSNGGPPGLFELTPDAEYFNELSLGSATLHDPTGLAWIKPTLLVVDADYQSQGVSTGLKVFVTSSQGTVIVTVPFSKTKSAQGAAVRAGVALVADQGGDAVQSYSIANGSLISTLNDKPDSPLAVAISQGT
jgi:hypothetical protein